MLVKLLGRPEAEAQSFEAKAGRVRDIGIAQATYARVFFVALTLTASLATAIVYGFGGVAAVTARSSVGTVVALTSYLTRLYGPLTQLSNLQPRRHDRARLLRAALRGARHRPHDRGGPRRRRHPPGTGHHRVRPRRLHLPERRGGLPGLARVGGRARVGPAQRGAPRRLLPGRAGPDGGAGRARRARARPPSPRWSPASTTSPRGRCG